MIYEEIKKDIFTMDKNKWYFGHCIASDFGMGAGIAVQFQKKFNLRNKLSNSTEDSSPGSCILINNVFNLITKKRSSGKPTYKTLESSLLNMRNLIVNDNIQFVAMPQIGCGLDRLSWPVVRKYITNVFDDVDVFITICKWR